MKWCSKLLLWFLVHSEMFSIHINHGIVQAKMRLSLLFVSDCKSTQLNTKMGSDHYSHVVLTFGDNTQIHISIFNVL